MFKRVCSCVIALTLLTSASCITSNASMKEVPSNSAFKAYMSYRAITNKASNQYKLQQECETDVDGLRVYDNRYVVAVGTYYTNKIGTKLDVYLDNGTVLPCITGDIKSDMHTDTTNRFCQINHSVIEFLVDPDNLNEDAKRLGNVSSIPGFDGNITGIDVHTADNLDMSADISIPESNLSDADSTDSKMKYTVLSKFYVQVNKTKRLYFVEYNVYSPDNCILCSESDYYKVIPGETKVSAGEETEIIW